MASVLILSFIGHWVRGDENAAGPIPDIYVYRRAFVLHSKPPLPCRHGDGTFPQVCDPSKRGHV